jgi:general secretion pathway protein L
MTMSDTLILRYPTDDADTECVYLRVDHAAAPLAPPSAGPLSEAAEAAVGCRVIWIVPGDLVSLSRPVLPPKSGKRLPTLVPFALEDQLAADVDALHFAIGPQADDGAVETAIIDREVLSAALTTLQSHGLKLTAAYGTIQVTPAIPATTVLLIDGGKINVREPDGAAYCADLIPGLSTRECLALAESEERPCIVYTTSTSFTTLEAPHSPDDGLPAGGHYVGGGPQFLEYGPLQKYAEVALRNPPVNLLQGPYAPTSDAAAGWARWRVPVYVLLAVVFVNVVASSVDWYRAHRESVRLDSELHAAYAQALPGVDPGRLPAPRLVVEGRMRRVAQAGRGGLIAALDALGAAMVATPGATVKSVNFHDGAVEAVISAADLASLNQVQQSIGAAARLASVSTPDPQHAEGRLEIAGGNP